jgi:hypothetical protein
VRREARTSRQSQARLARLLADSYGFDKHRIAEMLDVEIATVARVLSAEGVTRCVECAFGVHRSCMGEFDIEIDGQPTRCACECQLGKRPTA